jgi:hypothetical protein
LNLAWWNPEDESGLPLLRAFPRLEGPELLLLTEGVVLPPGVLVAVGVVPTVDVGVGAGGA